MDSSVPCFGSITASRPAKASATTSLAPDRTSTMFRGLKGSSSVQLVVSFGRPGAGFD